MLESNVVEWTARVSVFCYLAALLFHASGRRARLARGLWRAGFAVFLMHLLAAFQFVHGWSHAAAWEHTAQQTRDLVGWDWGGGVWFNYLFAIAWGADILLGNRMRTARGPSCRLIQAYLAFIVFNATVVFGAEWWKLVAAAYLPALLLVRLTRPGTRPPRTSSDPAEDEPAEQHQNRQTRDGDR
jgi:hypothetical protein